MTCEECNSHISLFFSSNLSLPRDQKKRQEVNPKEIPNPFFSQKWWTRQSLPFGVTNHCSERDDLPRKRLKNAQTFRSINGSCESCEWTETNQLLTWVENELNRAQKKCEVSDSVINFQSTKYHFQLEVYQMWKESIMVIL